MKRLFDVVSSIYGLVVLSPSCHLHKAFVSSMECTRTAVFQTKKTDD